MRPPAGRQVAILGSPVAQALSPTIHRAAYRAHGIDWSYHAIECTTEQLPGFITSLGEDWAGLSLTRPLKTAAVPLMHHLSAVARIIGSINTVAISRGQFYGENTDVYGMVAALAEVGTTWASTAAVVGSGGTARTALAALSALHVANVVVVARNAQAVGQLAPIADALGISLDILPWSFARAIRDHECVIFTLPPHAADELAPHMIGYKGTVLDVVYGADPTLVSKAASRSGHSRVAQGLSMLVHQASRQFQLQTGIGEVAVDVMRRAAEEELSAKRTLGNRAKTCHRYAERSVPAVHGGST